MKHYRVTAIERELVVYYVDAESAEEAARKAEDAPRDRTLECLGVEEGSIEVEEIEVVLP